MTLKSPAIHIKHKFIKQNFLILFCIFILPTTLLGGFLVLFSFKKTQEANIQKVDNSLALAQQYLNDMSSNDSRIGLYLENTTLLLSLDRMMNLEEISYAESIMLKQFSSFINSIINTSSITDSIYIYMPNDLKRVYTSSQQFTLVSTLSDSEWITEFLLPQPPAIMIRSKKEYSFEDTNLVLSSFNQFHRSSGGWVTNYSVPEILKYFQSLTAIPGQSIALLDSNGSCIISHGITSDVLKQSLNDFHAPYEGKISINNTSYLARSSYHETYQLYIVSLVPLGTLYASTIADIQNIATIILFILALTLLMAYFLSLNSYRQLHQIIEWFDQAEHKKGLTPYKKKDIYLQILQNIIKVFIDNDRLQVEVTEQEYRKKLAELEALQYQINPHFLFNTLQTIHYEIFDLTNGKVSKAHHMIEDLSDLLRYALGSVESLVTLAEEMANCEKYIRIQQERYMNSFLFQYQIPPSLLQIKIPRLIFQPIIENSIIHGLKGQTNGIISVQAIPNRTFIFFSIKDNGQGMTFDALKKLQNELTAPPKRGGTGQHIGLSNCNERLILTYGKESSLKIQSKKHRGFLVEFQIPNKK